MKKLAVILVSMCFILSMAAVANASQSKFNVDHEFYSGTETTEKRNVAEYCELFMYRAARYKYAGLASGIEPNIYYSVFPSFNNSTVQVSVASGYVYVNTKDLTIEEAHLTLHDFTESDEENDTHLYVAAIGLSALEYGSMDDAYFGTFSVNGSSSTAEEGFRILTENFDKFVYGDGMDKAFDGEDVLIYSGNYDYYVRYMYNKEPDIDYELNEFELIAKARD